MHEPVANQDPAIVSINRADNKLFASLVLPGTEQMIFKYTYPKATVA